MWVSENELKTLQLTYQGKTNQDIADELKVTRERIRQLQVRLAQMGLEPSQDLHEVYLQLFDVVRAFGVNRYELAKILRLNFSKLVNLTRNKPYKDSTRIRYINEIIKFINQRIDKAIIALDKIGKK